MNETKKNEVLQWHPAFFAGIQIEFEEEKENLIFENEHQLSKKPLEIDVLIFYKALGYAYLYKADMSSVDEIKIEDVALTFVCHRYPRN